jgi:tetratricopeptide (TPR) repeat protein
MKTYKPILLTILLSIFLFSGQVSVLAAGKSPINLEELPSVGKVEFEISCEPKVQELFNQGVAMLHHMMYAQSRDLFNEILRSDPDCAMLHWGVAMTYLHPLWAPPTQSDLKNGMAAVSRARELNAPTSREASYIDAISTYFNDWQNFSHPERLARWELAQREVHLSNPDDIDAAGFYALSHLATAPKSDKTFAHQKSAGQMLEGLHSKAPMHPAGYHYTIHAYDNPMLADRALEVARGYGTIAPDVPHALHMPTHIFVRLGLWDDVIEWNKRSAGAALNQPVNGMTSLHYAHAIDYLVYGYLQKGQEQEANRILAELNATDNFQDSFASAYAIAAAQARIALERSEWEKAAALPIRTHQTFPWDKYPWFESITFFAKGIGSARSGDIEAANANLGKLNEFYDRTREAGQDYWAILIDSQRKSVESWTMLSQGQKPQALELMREAADLEDSVDKHPVTPGAVLPARELLGDMLIELGQYNDSIAAYERALEISANRLRSLTGIETAERLAAQKNAAVLPNASGDAVAAVKN